MSDFYEWDKHFQREIIGLLLNDRNFMIQCVSLVKPFYFQDEIHQSIVKVLGNFWDKYKQQPNRNSLFQEVKSLFKIDDEQKSREINERIACEINEIYLKFVPNFQLRDYYKDKVLNFAKTQELKMSFKRCLEEVKKAPEDEKTWSKVREDLTKALLIDINFDVGLDYFVDYEERYRRRLEVVEQNEMFTSGFLSIDEAFKNKGLLRGEIGAYLGLSGTGKSLALVTASIANMSKYEHKVLYVSLEIDQDAVAERFDAQISDVKIGGLLENKDVVFQALKDYVEQYDDKRMLVIKRFAPGTLDVAGLKAYMNQLSLHGFRPDLLIVDYVGEMKDVPGVPTHESRYRIVRDLRALAVDENVCILTALQPNKTAKEVNKMNDMLDADVFIDDENIGDSYAQIRPLDAMWSINQIPDEKRCNLGRIFVSKTREGKSKFHFWIKYDEKTLKLEEISSNKWQSTMVAFRNEKVSTKTKQAGQRFFAEERATEIASNNKGFANEMASDEE